MTRLFIEGWETGNSGAWQTAAFDVGSSMPLGFSGNYFGSPSNSQIAYVEFAQQTEIYMAMKFRWGYSGNYCGIFTFRDSAGTSILSGRLEINTGEFTIRLGNQVGTQLAISTTTFLPIGTVHLIEVYYKPLNTGGVVQVKLDGIMEINYSGDTTAGLENIAQFLIGKNTSYIYGSYDDIVLDNADWIGNTRIQKLQISGAGTTSEWDASAGNPEDCIDEIPYSDSDFVSTNVVNQSLTCACADMTGDIVSIKCLQLHGRMAYEGAPTPTKQKLAIRVNGSEYYGDDKSPALSFSVVSKLWELNPDDAAAWEEADINAIEIGVRSVT